MRRRFSFLASLALTLSQAFAAGLDARCKELLQAVDQVNVEAATLAVEDMAGTWPDRYDGAKHRAAIKAFVDRREALVGLLGNRDKKAATEAQRLVSGVRNALLANPLLDFGRLLVVKRIPLKGNARKIMGGALGVGSLNAHTSDTIPRQDVFKDELAVLSDLRGVGRFSTIYTPAKNQTLIDPVLHFDGDRLLFAQQGAKEKNWRLFEIKDNGKGLRQATPDDGADVAHFDPCYLPDGRIIFASTAVYQGLPCEFGGRAMACLYQLDPRTQSIRQLTFEQDSDWCPTMLHNGRVMYLRWEYTDQSHSNSRILFHMNPDGTDQRELRGSGSWFPNSFFYAKAIPGDPRRVIGVAGGHHGTPRSGRLLVLDPSQGRRDAEGIVQEIPGRGKTIEPIVRDRLVDGVWPQFLMPAPLSGKYHLVVAKPAADSLWGIYLVDVFDNMTLVKEVEGSALLWPVPMRKTETPPVIPDRVDLSKDTADVVIADIYAGPGLAGIPRGTVKRLRVVEYYFGRRGMGGLYGTLGIDGPWDIKRILGTVPVEEDGSAHFSIPANTALAIQPLDGKGQALQLMRSWFVGMPGEQVSCVGCHESQNEAPIVRPGRAQRREPSLVEPWHGPARGFSFVREVQPVLDRYCANCHSGQPREGREIPSFKGGVPLTDWSSQMSGSWPRGGKFTESYFELQRYVRRPGIEGERRMFTPMDYHFSQTELGQMLRKGHYGVRLDGESWVRLAAWVDLNAVFFGTWGEIPGIGASRMQIVDARAMELRRKYVPMGPFPDYETIPETPPYEPTPVPPLPLEERMGAPVSETECPDWPFAPDEAIRRQIRTAPEGRVAMSFETGGSNAAIEMVWVPDGEFLMGSDAGHRDEQPVIRVPIADGFWMGRHEISNAQYREFDPEHESRTEDRHGYQFGIVGYGQDQADQPVVRVSWEEAMAFCHWLSEKTGKKVTLPTEAQWEWACRAGSGAPFWFGEGAVDYSPYANLGDLRLREFAADTSADGYSRAALMSNPSRYDDWVPHDSRFDDGGFVTRPVGQYKPNPWGLHDMHGNAAEWTLSAYKPYPYEDDDGRNDGDPDPEIDRVARGGSWYDRPFRCASGFRTPYSPYQRVFNVGFRVVVE